MSVKKGLFISGTDTGVGKTLISSLIVAGLKSCGMTVGYFKPVQTGSDLDTETVRSYSQLTDAEYSAPTYQLALPAAPSRAAQAEGVEIELARIQSHWAALDARNWVVEGAGGLLVPLRGRQTIRDLIRSLRLDLVLVASTRLGTLNHILLSLESAAAAEISTQGIILVGDEDPGLEKVIPEYTDIPILTRIPHFPVLSSSVIKQAGGQYFPRKLLERLYGVNE
jgi:dethiobiotin synthetase